MDRQSREYGAVLHEDLRRKYKIGGSDDSDDLDQLNFAEDTPQELRDAYIAEKKGEKIKLFKEEFCTRMEEASRTNKINIQNDPIELFDAIEAGQWDDVEGFKAPPPVVEPPKSESEEEVEEELQEKQPEVIYRDATGKRVTKEEWGLLKGIDTTTGERLKKQKEKQDWKPEPVAWGKGVKQQQEDKEREEYEAATALEAFARYEITEAYDKELREEIHDEDPMAFMFKKDPLVEKGGVGEGGTHLKPKPIHVAPSNRFQIPAGYRWDGVVRGVGFEERFLTAKSLKEDREANWKAQNQEFSDDD